MHDSLHKNVNENMWKHVFIHIFMHNFMIFYEICYSFALLISYMVFNPFEMVVQFFSTASSFPNFDGLNAFFPSSTGPWPDLKKGRKISVMIYLHQ